MAIDKISIKNFFSIKELDLTDLKSKKEIYIVGGDEEFTQKSEKPYSNILAYGASRNNYCQMKEDTSGYLTLFKGEYDLKSPIKWS